MRIDRLITFVVAALAVLPASAALGPRVFVSPDGMDVGTCAISAPCRNFAYAITQVAAGGEIIALKTAGYGPVIIDKSVSIIAAPGVTAFIAATSGVDAVDIFTTVSDTVTLRGLALKGLGAQFGTWGGFVRTLNIENCLIEGFIQDGVQFASSANNAKPHLLVLNSVFRNNNEAIGIANYGAGTSGNPIPPNLTYVTVVNSVFTGTTNSGIGAVDNARVTISRSFFSGNTLALNCQGTHDYSQCEMNLDRCTVARNVMGLWSGFGGQTTSGIARLSNCQFTDNDTALIVSPGGSILSQAANGLVLTNTVEGNNSDGAAMGTYAAK